MHTNPQYNQAEHQSYTEEAIASEIYSDPNQLDEAVGDHINNGNDNLWQEALHQFANGNPDPLQQFIEVAVFTAAEIQAARYQHAA